MGNMMQALHKYLMIFFTIVLLYAQSAVAMHDSLHQHMTDDCVMCTVVENGNDKALDVNISDVFIEYTVSKVHVILEQNLQIQLWVRPSSRAPPLF